MRNGISVLSKDADEIEWVSKVTRPLLKNKLHTANLRGLQASAGTYYSYPADLYVTYMFAGSVGLQRT